MNDRVLETLWPRRLWAWILAVFSAIALVLSAVGVYGVMSTLVAQRTRELGVRLLLGASPRGVFGMVIGRGLALCALGGGMGAIGALALGRVWRSLLFGVGAADPTTFVASALALAASALIACWLPARRAARIEPVVVLASE